MSILVVTTPAESLALLTTGELRLAAGLDANDSSQDAALSALGLRVAASIMSECNIAVGSGAEPTLWQETLTETFRSIDRDQFFLARRHGVAITSVVEDGATLSTAAYEVNPESGLLMRLSSDAPARWCASKIVVVYKAGFVAIPGDLKQAASDFLRFSYLESQRDPALKSETIDIPDIERTERAWWVGSVPGQTFEGAVPDVVAGQLKRFRNIAIG